MLFSGLPRGDAAYGCAALEAQPHRAARVIWKKLEESAAVLTFEVRVHARSSIYMNVTHRAQHECRELHRLESAPCRVITFAYLMSRGLSLDYSSRLMQCLDASDWADVHAVFAVILRSDERWMRRGHQNTLEAHGAT